MGGWTLVRKLEARDKNDKFVVVVVCIVAVRLVLLSIPLVTEMILMNFLEWWDGVRFGGLLRCRS